jgi:hypothetical protein
VDELLRDASTRRTIGQAGRAIFQRHSDLPERTAAALLNLSPSACGRGEGGGGDASVGRGGTASAQSPRD